MKPRLQGPLPASLATTPLADLELRAATEAINAAYWRFTRCARGVPPAVAVPGAYVEQAWAAEAQRRHAAWGAVS